MDGVFIGQSCEVAHGHGHVLGAWWFQMTVLCPSKILGFSGGNCRRCRCLRLNALKRLASCVQQAKFDPDSRSAAGTVEDTAPDATLLALFLPAFWTPGARLFDTVELDFCKRADGFSEPPNA